MSTIGFDEALRTILSTVQPLPAEKVALAQALGQPLCQMNLAKQAAV